MEGKGCSELCLQINSTLVIGSCKNFPAGSAPWGKEEARVGAVRARRGKPAGACGSVPVWLEGWCLSLAMAQVRGLGKSKVGLSAGLVPLTSRHSRSAHSCVRFKDNIFSQNIGRWYNSKGRSCVCAAHSLESILPFPAACRKSNFKRYCAVTPRISLNENLIAE